MTHDAHVTAPATAGTPTGDASPRLTRRSALFGAAALLMPLSPRSSLAAAAAPAATPHAAAGPIRLDSNENPYGPSPAARRAILASIGDSPRYADSEIKTLAAMAATRDGVTPEQVTIGTGSGELLSIAALLAAEAGPGELVAAQPTFEDLPGYAAKFGVATHWVGLDAAHRHDLKAMAAAITPQTRLVYLCNPNNPTGTALGRDALETFIRAVPASVLVLADEAYLDLADAPGVASMAPLIASCPNLIVTRTFSKIHGLAGLRIGYGLAAPALAARMKAKQPAFPNVAGLRAAIASLDDHRFLAETRHALITDRARVQNTLDRLGLARAESQGNFVFFDTGRPHAEFLTAMLAHGVKVGRHFDRYDTWARVTIGTHAEVDRFLAVLPKALARSV